jgi:predicted transcriptional regulator
LVLYQGGQQMPDEPMTASTNQELTAEIVAAYARRNQIGTDQLATLISTVHQALANLGNPTTQAPDEWKPAVSARQSVHRDYVVCMDCSWKGTMLRRHLTTAHGLTIDEYRARWNLKPDHPVTALGYSERRSAMAKQNGLGRMRGASAEIATVPEPEIATATQPAPKRRGRPRSMAASA